MYHYFEDLPKSVQNEVNDRMDHDLDESRLTPMKMKHGRTVVKLKRKYRFATNRLGMN